MTTDETLSFKSERALKSVAIVSDDEKITSRINGVLGGLSNFSVKNQPGTLAGINGSAIGLAAENDLIIFQTSGSESEDIGAVRAIRRELDRSTKLLAMTPETISLADARRLTNAGVDDVLIFPFDDAEFRDQVKRITQPNQLVVVPEERDTGNAGRVITIAKSSGGIGATTIAVNLADQFLGRSGVLKKKTKNRVVVVDMDFQFGAIASFLDVEPRDALYNLAIEGTKPDITFLRQSIVKSPSGIDVLTAPARFAPLDGLTSEQVRAIVKLLRAEYDYVVIDLPRALVEWLAPVLEETDRLLLVTDSSVPGIRQSRRLIDFFTEDAINLQIDMVINRERKPLVAKSAHKEAAKVLERPLKHWLPPDPKAARASIDQGAPLSEVARRSHFTKAVAALAQTLTLDLANAASATVAAN
ncbi:AAA family ATPase [Flavimaricola marinus]|uniref:Septum site-determining protein MinD n=1 Tax=Flavimaricola marinus TaxID=1819565 RepID=A0A238LAX7_9RHOB|nr:AAA family ATPase [Flavimaricola marinus]SMY06126.1 Septum site-determining protein MinD [Flavimaricola marinus]